MAGAIGSGQPRPFAVGPLLQKLPQMPLNTATTFHVPTMPQTLGCESMGQPLSSAEKDLVAGLLPTKGFTH